MLNEKLKNLRLAKGLTLQQVGDVFGISKVSVSTWESGKTNPSRKRLEQLADLFGTTIQFLVTGIDSEVLGQNDSEKVPFCAWEFIKSDLRSSEEKSWIKPIHCRPSKTAFATRYVTPSSLAWQSPGIPGGSILIIDPEIHAGNGDYLLVETDSGEVLIAKQAVTPDNKSFLIRVDSLNSKPIPPRGFKTIGTILEWQISGKLK
jgi:transcriptional regulator with XRE-family HTH domain